jgi:hypothetical protein
VRLGELEAYRYAGLRLRGIPGRAALYAVPNTGGVATLACVPGRDGAAFLADCEQAASTLSLTGVRAFQLGPSPAYARSLGRTVRRLASARSRGTARLRQARTPGGQGAAAGPLAGAYLAAARSLARVTVSPADAPANRSLVALLRRVGSAYGRAASAARRGDGAGYASAARAVRRGDAAIARALRGLRRLGYRVG